MNNEFKTRAQQLVTEFLFRITTRFNNPKKHSIRWFIYSKIFQKAGIRRSLIEKRELFNKIKSNVLKSRK